MLNLTKCVEKGHKIVCLANMCPGKRSVSSGTTEIDSYCFQSIAQEHVPLIAKCMELPLYTAELIENSSLNQNLWYEKTEGDEVEELYKLLLRIKEAHPEVNALSTGAIESNFQRLRVVHLCERLELTHLGYLWKRPPKEILDDVLTSGIKAVFVKVSAMGLHPEDYLGKILDKEIAEKLLHVPYVHAAGEGGEFETFTLDSPLFTKGYIEITASRLQVLQSSEVVTSAVLEFSAKFVPR